MNLIDLLRDTQFRSDVASNVGQLGQSASNAVASNVSAPVDLLAMLLRKGGMPVPEKPFMGSGWFEDRGLTRKVPEGAPKVAGETLGMLAPLLFAKPAVNSMATGLNTLESNAMMPGPVSGGRQSQRGIVPVADALQMNTKRQLPQDPLFAEAVANTPGAKISNDGLLMQIMRNQKPEQAMSESVRGGVFYLPEGASQAKHYSTGKAGYGGADRIKGETLVSNPLFVKGATGGKAPEAAFDALKGKGAYQMMRNDALKAYRGYGATQDAKVEAAEAFLEKYAPEMMGQGYHIVKNSKEGNQLAYALQEAAAGSAARNAGHDAILGYSKGKSGPFLSELFDLRENLYPNKTGGYGTWPEF